MRRYNVRDITDRHYRALRVLLATQQAEAHIVVRSKRPWPSRIPLSPHENVGDVEGDAIN
ncbi:hypothetical protein [Sphingomonas hengshuiensis]|uniref:Uncharacterized protein n=1 Tax=Sphingomonas hengshuiensis TaxID=1609977 RepID=A0A7U5BEA0_9SPHN|nr:hypothetical protein [Sphingomonas hengshuiensis]AJP70705.1 hypothetical protein TS85_01005 [Sphingomonas hengshuiensis]